MVTQEGGVQQNPQDTAQAKATRQKIWLAEETLERDAMKTTQYKHQLEEYEAYRDARARALLWQPRTGKSKAVIDSACYLSAAMELRGVLVIAPNGVHRNWTDRELPAHHWDDVSMIRFAWVNSRPNNERHFEELIQLAGRHDMGWMTMNIESLLVKRATAAVKKFIKTYSPCMIVFDESHHFARANAKRTAVARQMSRKFDFRRILTGTPVENSPLQAFSQYELLQREALGHRNYGAFKEEFSEWKLKQYGWRCFEELAGYKNLDVLKERMAPFTSVVLRSDVEDLPPVRIMRSYSELTAEQEKWHESAKAVDMAFLESRGTYDPLNGGALLFKLQQIEGGFWKRGDGRPYDRIVPLDSNPKMLALREQLSGYDGQVIVWCQFLHEIDAVAEALREWTKRRTEVIHGKVKDRSSILSMFRKGKLDALVCQPAAAGEGLDMSTARLMVWYSQTPNAVTRTQANERATAVGKTSTDIVDLVVPGGVDEYFLELTDERIEMADDISRRGMQAVLEQISLT